MTAERTHTNALGRLSVWKDELRGTIRTPTGKQYQFTAAKTGPDYASPFISPAIFALATRCRHILMNSQVPKISYYNPESLNSVRNCYNRLSLKLRAGRNRPSFAQLGSAPLFLTSWLRRVKAEFRYYVVGLSGSGQLKLARRGWRRQLAHSSPSPLYFSGHGRRWIDSTCPVAASTSAWNVPGP
jgi:hypothetical protein